MGREGGKALWSGERGPAQQQEFLLGDVRVCVCAQGANNLRLEETLCASVSAPRGTSEPSPLPPQPTLAGDSTHLCACQRRRGGACLVLVGGGLVTR